MIGAVGDLVEDVVVQLGGPINLASDTDAVIAHRRGGSAANVAVAAAAIDGRARFIGCVGDDPLGADLLGRLDAAGVEFAGRRVGRSGTIVVLVDETGERTMLSDRGSSAELVAPERIWLGGLDALHLPFYSLAVEPLATTCRTLIEWAHADGLPVSIDASSTAVIEAFGLADFHDLLRDLAPDLVFANEDEAALIGPGGLAAKRLVVHGPRTAAVVVGPVSSVEVTAHDLGPVADSTGAGDAFAAGFLSAAAAGADDAAAAQSGHDAARRHLVRN